MMVSNPTSYFPLSINSFGTYLSAAEKQQKGYFTLLQQNGIIDKGETYTEIKLKNGIYKLVGRVGDEFNSKDISDKHVQEMGDALREKILSEDYITIERNGVEALIQQALKEGDIPKKTGLIREMMTIEGLAKMKGDLVKSGVGEYKIVDTSPRGGFADSLRYDIGVAFENGLINTKDMGYVRNQLNLEIKSRLSSFHITGFKGVTLLGNEAYVELSKKISDEVQKYFITNKSMGHMDSSSFRKTLATWVVKWKLGRIFPIFFSLGEKGGSRNVLLCTEYIRNITGNVGVTDIISYAPIPGATQKRAAEVLEREDLTPQQIETVKKKAADIVMKSINKYDLWYGKK